MKGFFRINLMRLLRMKDSWIQSECSSVGVVSKNKIFMCVVVVIGLFVQFLFFYICE